MVPGYRNCVYIPKQRECILYTWDDKGNRVERHIPFSPYVYLENATGREQSIFDTTVAKKTFNTAYDKNQFIQSSGIKRLFNNVQPQHQFLIDTYSGLQNADEFSANPLKIWFLDIETYSPDSWPDKDTANHEINAITIYDSIEKKYYTLGTKPFTSTDVTYIQCRNERDLLLNLIFLMEKDYPDIITAHNGEFFDFPYIANRIKRILGEEYMVRLSPVGRVYYRNVFNGKFGKPSQRLCIDGVALLDFLDVYKRFCLTLRESYRLDAIAEIELGENKLDYGDTSLADLADTDWNKFVEYNIHDVRLLVMLEEKLQYFKLLRMLSYIGLCTFEQAMGTLVVIVGATILKGLEIGKVVPTFIRNDEDHKNPGAYVAEPVRGFSEHIVSFDANSLYPNLMLSLNMSPETKIGKISKRDELNTTLVREGNATSTFTNAQFLKFIKQEGIAISAAGVLFSQKKQGIIPGILDQYYKDRQQIQKKLKENKLKLSDIKKSSPNTDTTELETLVSQLNAKQLCIKIFLNSIYGFFGNKQSPFGDDDIAASITLTGQAAIKQSNIIYKKFVDEKIPGNTLTDADLIKYNDTDSLYISLTPLIKELNIQFSENNVPTKPVYDIVQELETYINTEIKKWGSRILNSTDCRLVFKREAIADVGIFLQKKRYILHTLDVEGVVESKYKYTGVEIVRTSMPAKIKPYAKRIVETLLHTKDINAVNKLLHETYDIFKTLPAEDMAFVMGIKDLEKYTGNCRGYTTGKGTPIHVKSAYFYNTLLKEFNIDTQYEEITSGDKVRYVYVEKPNKFNIETVGFKYTLPDEFKFYFKIDYDTMFDKILFASISRIYEAVGWVARKPRSDIAVNLLDFFS